MKSKTKIPSQAPSSDEKPKFKGQVGVIVPGDSLNMEAWIEDAKARGLEALPSRCGTYTALCIPSASAEI